MQLFGSLKSRDPSDVFDEVKVEHAHDLITYKKSRVAPRLPLTLEFASASSA